jgi:sn-glycerol 3-phosphate transport system substrate-binding protein
MNGRQRIARLGAGIAVVVAGLVATGAVAPDAGAAAASTKCPVGAIKSSGGPVQITLWHSFVRANLDTLTTLVNQFNSSQSAVKVNLVSQVDYDDTFTKYKAGLSSGDLPDIVLLQESDQQQMIDTGTVLPASVCAKATKYSFSDFLPRVLSYFTVKGVTYAMPFNVSGPVLYYNKKAFTAAGLDPNKPPTTLAEVRADALKLKSSGAVQKAALGLKTDPGYVDQWFGLSNQLFSNNNNGRTARVTKTLFNSSTGLGIFNWMSGMVKDGLAAPNPDTGNDAFDDLLGIGNGNYAMAIDTSASLGTISSVLSSGAYPNVDLGVAPMPGLTNKGGILVQGGALYMVNKSSPAKEEASWRFLQFLDSPQNQAAWAVGTGYVPITKMAAANKTMQDFWATNPEYKVAYNQLLTGANTPATAGSVIGPYVDVRDAIRDAENSMFDEGTAPKTALTNAANTANSAITSYNSRIGAG